MSTEPELRRVVREDAEAFVLSCYVLAEATGEPIGNVLERAVLDARARLVERGVLTNDEKEES